MNALDPVYPVEESESTASETDDEPSRKRRRHSPSFFDPASNQHRPPGPGPDDGGGWVGQRTHPWVGLVVKQAAFHVGKALCFPAIVYTPCSSAWVSGGMKF